ncbi:hypothetical protein BDV95DRAFT_663917 [Massariosphaeria phaeospora]|uniref:Uncharacterized protein n=1 Tax=Massariosphaeria phaeospora TaxID=100035 RepID=A0A7C8MFF0_9PLEO|nr:hypothetical protein BDV95DRAFT_663917 [Massariosphaeria phaeospora]
MKLSIFIMAAIAALVIGKPQVEVPTIGTAIQNEAPTAIAAIQNEDPTAIATPDNDEVSANAECDKNGIASSFRSHAPGLAGTTCAGSRTASRSAAGANSLLSGSTGTFLKMVSCMGLKATEVGRQ